MASDNDDSEEPTDMLHSNRADESDESDSEEEDEEEEEAQHEQEPDISQPEEPVTYEDVDVNQGDPCLTLSELEDDDTELWLVRVPHHPTLMESLVKHNIKMESGDGENDEKIIPVPLKGSYTFRERDFGELKHLRSTFVVDHGEHRQVKIAKPFARTVSLSFDATITDLSHLPAKMKTYPEKPKKMKMQYHAIGSSARSGMNGCHDETTTVIAPSQITPTARSNPTHAASPIITPNRESAIRVEEPPTARSIVPTQHANGTPSSSSTGLVKKKKKKRKDSTRSSLDTPKSSKRKKLNG